MTPPDTRFDVGIVGAGQLARMTCLAAWPLGLRVAVLGTPDEPAAGVAAGLVEGSWQDAEAVARLGAVCDVVTLENEFVDAAALAAVEAAGTPVRPGAAALATVQDKALQKAMLQEAGLPVPQWRVLERPADIGILGRELGWPMVVKARTLGYDGYGNATCRTPEDVAEAMTRLDRGTGVLAERWVPFRWELAVMVARTTTGTTLPYPVVQTVQRDHVCHEVVAPAAVTDAVAERAREVALRAAEAADALGVMGVELFLMEDGSVLVNELAPRPHNSGHYTIEACETSQFENHLRGVLGLPLGPTRLRMPAAAMVNILGASDGPSRPDLAATAAVEGAHLHLYDKLQVRVRRKMGHVTALGDTAEAALRVARAGAAAVGL
ncbi:MAG: 5-(carboxyamino)imidazole ribonucleotide synthase [Thermoleophilia bacterium]